MYFPFNFASYSIQLEIDYWEQGRAQQINFKLHTIMHAKSAATDSAK